MHDDYYKHFEIPCSFKKHSEIPKDLVDYIIGVAEVKDINELDLEEINDFLNGYDKFIDKTSTYNG